MPAFTSYARPHGMAAPLAVAQLGLPPGSTVLPVGSGRLKNLGTLKFLPRLLLSGFLTFIATEGQSSKYMY
jgi:hypothetical protein